jgi:hypothetical protein
MPIVQMLCRSALIALATSIVAAPVVAAEQPVDFTACISSRFEFISVAEGINTFRVENRGIVMSNHEHRLLHNAAYEFVGVGFGPAGKPMGFGYVKLTDPSDNVLILELKGLPSDLAFTFLQGTGPWKGISGGGKAARTASTGIRMSGTTGASEGCLRFTGTLDVRK